MYFMSDPQALHIDVWSSCLCGGCASNLELTVGWTAKPGSPQCHLPTQLEDVSVSTILGTLSALEALCDYALYKSTYTLHYITLHVTRNVIPGKLGVDLHLHRVHIPLVTNFILPPPVINFDNRAIFTKITDKDISICFLDHPISELT